jgi:hypothetical protein
VKSKYSACHFDEPRSVCEEKSPSGDNEISRGGYTERSECARNDKGLSSYGDNRLEPISRCSSRRINSAAANAVQDHAVSIDDGAGESEGIAHVRGKLKVQQATQFCVQLLNVLWLKPTNRVNDSGTIYRTKLKNQQH